MSTVQIDRLLDTVIRNNASDLHLTTGRKPTIRLHGGLRSLLEEMQPQTIRETTKLFKIPNWDEPNPLLQGLLFLLFVAGH